MLDSWNYRLSPSPSITSSTRSSHLSSLTSASTASSPPPSPTGSKTHAFFASPFAEEPSPPQPPASPSNKTHAFFASPFAESIPQPPPNPHTRSGSGRSDTSGSDRSEVSAEDTPRVQHKAPARSLNADFFGPSLLPTPPRASADSPPHATNVRRDFVHLDIRSASHAHPDHYHAGEETQSPVDFHYPPPSAPSSAEVTPTPTSHRDETSYVSERPPTPPQSDPEQPPRYLTLEPGVTLSSSSLSLELVKTLGTGSFSSVWLARDTTGQLNALELVRKSSLARSKSLRGRRSRTIDGTRPLRRKAKDRSATDGHPDEEPMKQLGAARSGRLVAVKMTERTVCDANSRSRVSFVREVEVLRHISHPSIVSYLHSFSTPSHHCLVLEHIGGGELLDIIDNPESHARISEPLVRRIWGELCRAVAWMHSVGLVHRDIKLENILLTTDPFTQPLPSHSLIKLTDFGLSRFIDPAQPQLTTLCGSDSYAAPELVMGRPYDGRETDAWACGVVLYAIATRRLPFDSPVQHIPHDHPAHMEADWKVQQRKRAERKALLNRIAQGSYSWPEAPHSTIDEQAYQGAALARSGGIRRMVAKLLVRDPRKRARVADLWTDGWMHGEGAPPPPVLDAPSSAYLEPMPLPLPAEDEVVPIIVNCVDGSQVVVDVSAYVDVDAEAEADEEGVLVDGEDIGPGSVARQEH
ncbi:kinase-like domain-containing protein [Daedaleopsis nitida]|nr:kinase-like domain-containing protein [Daedaleopsis nitida]